MEQEEKTCTGCQHFVQHYAKVGNHTYVIVYSGHCGNPRIREKKPDTPACQRFSEIAKK